MGCLLKATLPETRQAAIQGVEAIRLEADLYSAAVAAPGLLPLQYTLNRLMPYTMAALMEENLKSTLSDVKNTYHVRKLTLQEFSASSSAPR
jgi:hypothetical protein